MTRSERRKYESSLRRQRAAETGLIGLLVDAIRDGRRPWLRE